MKLIRLALEQPGESFCGAGDANDDGRIQVDEVVVAARNLDGGCAPLATATPTLTGGSQATATVTLTPTRTLTPQAGTVTLTPTRTLSPQPGTDIARPASGAAVVMGQSLRAIPAVVSALTQLARSGSSSAYSVRVGAPRTVSNCNGGGNRDFTCTQAVPGVPPRNYALSFASCALNTSGGAKIIVNGPMSGRSDESGFLASCSLPPLALASMVLNGVTVEALDASSQRTLLGTFNLNGSAVVTPDLSSSCRISAFEMTVSGSAVVEAGALSVTMGFNTTRMKVAVQQFSSDCVPLRYTMTINGPLSLTTPSFGEFAATYTDFVFGDDTSGGGDLVTLNGLVQSNCFAAPVTYATDTAMTLVRASACPTAGVLRLSAGSATDRVHFTSSGGVEIDRGNNGSTDETYPSCTAAELTACPRS